MGYNNGLAQKVLAGIGMATVVTFGIATCAGAGYSANRWYKSSLAACVEKQEVECPETVSCPECPEAGESECSIINLDDLFRPSAQAQPQNLCDEITKALSKKGSAADVQSVVKTYVSSNGGEIIVKDANALYSMLVAPKQESKCDDEKLEKKFVEKMIELYPAAANLKPHGAEDRNYVTLRTRGTGLAVELAVNDALVYDLSRSTDL